MNLDTDTQAKVRYGNWETGIVIKKDNGELVINNTGKYKGTSIGLKIHKSDIEKFILKEGDKVIYSGKPHEILEVKKVVR